MPLRPINDIGGTVTTTSQPSRVTSPRAATVSKIAGEPAVVVNFGHSKDRTSDGRLAGEYSPASVRFVGGRHGRGPAAAPAEPTEPAAPPAPTPEPAPSPEQLTAQIDTPSTPVPTTPTPTPTPTTPHTVGEGGVVAGSGRVLVDVLASGSDYENQIYWSSDDWATRHQVGVDNHQGTVDLGTFEPGTVIRFGIDNGQGSFFTTGGAAANPDGLDHARLSAGDDGITVGFEDLYQGGDLDYDDATIRVRSAPVDVASPPRTNRSGLGDGTNPGQGAGRIHAPAIGEDNPSARRIADALAAALSSAPELDLSVRARRGPHDGKIGYEDLVAGLEVGEAGRRVHDFLGASRPPQRVQRADHAERQDDRGDERDKERDNRSGLGDGTNPGRGAGRARSPNEGTANPGDDTASAAAVTAAATAGTTDAARLTAARAPSLEPPEGRGKR